MTEDERDALFAKVFATPAAAELLADYAARGRQLIVIREINERVGRQRKRWATGPEQMETP